MAMQGTSRKLSEPDLTLDGHTDDAEFALGMANPEPLVASGGKDCKVCPVILSSRCSVLQHATAGPYIAHGTARVPDPGVLCL